MAFAAVPPPIAIPPFVEQPAVSWETSIHANAVRALRLAQANAWLAERQRKKRIYEDPAEWAPESPVPFFIRNYATVTIFGGLSFTKSDMSAGGDPGIHSERGAFRLALEAACLAQGINWLTPRNPLSFDATRLRAELGVYISSVYSERELCKPAHGGSQPCAGWLAERAGGYGVSCPVYYSYQYNGADKRRMRDEIITYLRWNVEDSDEFEEIMELWKDQRIQQQLDNLRN